MADWYINGETGDPVLGDGSSGNPWKTIAQGFGSWASGDTFYLAGVCRGQNTLTISNATFKQWPGATACKLRGATVIESWTDDTSGAWFATLSGASNVHSVIINPDDPTVLDSNGNAKVHLTAATSLANCRATDNSWWQDTGTNRLYVRIDVSEDPAGYVVEWCAGATSGLVLTGSGNRIEGIEIGYFCDTDSGTPGYAVFLVGSNNVVSNVVTRDCGYHSIGVVGSGAKSNNLFENCTCRGLYPLVGTAVGHLVFYATADGSANNRAVNCTLYCHSALNREGTAINAATAPVQGCYSHTDGGGRVLNGTRWQGVTCHYLYGNPGIGFQAANVTAASDPDDWKTYGSQCIECAVYGGATINYGLDEAISHYRCTFRLSNPTAASAYVIGSTIDDANTLKVNFTACEIFTTLDAAGFISVFRFRGSGVRFSMVNTTVVDVGDGTNQRAFNNPWNSSPVMYARGCIFEFKNTNAGLRHFYINDTFDQTGTPRNFSNNIYVNVVSTVYSSQATYNTAAEWLSLIDTGAIQTSTSPLAGVVSDSATTGNAGLTAAGKALIRYTSPATDYGFNNLPYSGNYGAWQYGSEGGMMGRGRSWRGRARLERTQSVPG